MALTALRGALGFLSRLPVGHDDRAWRAFRETPTAFPLAGYVIGAILALPLALSTIVPVPDPTVALAFVLAVYLTTGLAHVDGVTDLGDALATHGDAGDRRAAMTDTAVGAGGALSAAIVVLGLGTAALALAELSATAVVLVVVAEVGAKLGMASVVCLGTAAHEGLGSALTERATPTAMLSVAAVAVPAALLTWHRPLVGVASLTAAVVVALAVRAWATRRLGGVSGDVIGAANETGRVVALHVGVVAWTLS